jgi:hypothetical protein
MAEPRESAPQRDRGEPVVAGRLATDGKLVRTYTVPPPGVLARARDPRASR